MKIKNKILTSVSLYHSISDGSIAVISILFPIFKSIFNLNYTQVGIITGGGLIVTLISQLIIGQYADGKNSAKLLSTGILLVCISMLLLTQSNSYVTLILFILILRFSSSFFHPIGVGWISRTFKKDRIDWAMGIQSGCADIGAFISVSTTLYISGIYGWSIPLYLWSIIGAIILLIGIFLTFRIDEEYLFVNKIIKKQSLKKSVLKNIQLLKRIKLLSPAFIISGAAWGVTITFLPLLLYERTTLSLPFIGILVALWIGFGSIISFAYGKIASILDRKKIIQICYTILGLTGLALSVFTNTYILILIMILLGISTFLTYPALFSFISEATHESIEGKTFGIIFTLQLGGGTILLFLSGLFSDIYGIWIPFALIGVLSLLY